MFRLFRLNNKKKKKNISRQNAFQLQADPSLAQVHLQNFAFNSVGDLQRHVSHRAGMDQSVLSNAQVNEGAKVGDVHDGSRYDLVRLQGGNVDDAFFKHRLDLRFTAIIVEKLLR